MHNHSYENEFNLHVNGISFSYERMSTKTCFEKEAKGNSEMAYLKYASLISKYVTQFIHFSHPVNKQSIIYRNCFLCFDIKEGLFHFFVCSNNYS